MRKNIFAVILVIICFFCSSAQIQANQIVFSEDFSQDLAQWQPTRDDGRAWQIINQQVDVFLETAYTVTELIPTDAVWNHNWRNLEYELDYIPLSGVDKNISFGFKNLENWYEIHFAEDFFNLVKVKNGQKPFDINRPFILENGQSYRVKILFQTGLIQVYIDNQLVAEEFDHTFDNDYGKIGIKVSTGAAYPTHVRFDNISVKPLLDDGLVLPLPLIMQNDPTWGEDIYDMAQKWSSNPTINRWGCALTSMVMIFHYYGLRTFPDGSSITPITLNTWLNNQPDGYIGEGLVNWQALTRLTQQLSAAFGTPKLEYQWIGSKVWETTLSELEQGRPVMLNIPEHFLLATGFTGNKQDLHINDPFYSYSKFLEHQKEIISLRTFKPSQTDLSYLLITHATDVEVVLKDAQNQTLSNLQSFSESLKDPTANSQEKTQVTRIKQLVKPDSQVLQLSFSQASLKPFEISIFAYDRQGTVTDLSLTGTAGPQLTSVILEYQKDQPSQIKSKTTWSKLRQQVSWLTQYSEIKRYLTYYQLNQIITRAQLQSLAHQRRYLDLFENQLRILTSTMSLNAKNSLHFYSQQLSDSLSQPPP